MTLSGKTILITRTEEQSRELVAEIERRGGTPLVFPMISISDPSSWAECDATLRRLREHDAIVFASTNGVSGFMRRCSTLDVTRADLSDLKVFAVGTSTRKCLEQHGVDVDETPDVFTMEELVECLRKHSPRRIMHVRGNLGDRDFEHVASSWGAVVTPVVVYETRIDGGTKGDLLPAMLRRGEIDVVTFASPSAVRGFAMHVRPDECHVLVAVIGPSTASAATDAGFHPHIVAPVATGADLVDAIEAYFRQASAEPVNVRRPR